MPASGPAHQRGVGGGALRGGGAPPGAAPSGGLGELPVQERPTLLARGGVRGLGAAPE